MASQLHLGGSSAQSAFSVREEGSRVVSGGQSRLSAQLSVSFCSLCQEHHNGSPRLGSLKATDTKSNITAGYALVFTFNGLGQVWSAHCLASVRLEMVGKDKGWKRTRSNNNFIGLCQGQLPKRGLVPSVLLRTKLPQETWQVEVCLR